MSREPNFRYLSTCPLDGTVFGFDDPETAPSVLLSPDGSLIAEGGAVPDGSARHALCPGCVENVRQARAQLGKHDWPRTYAGE